MFDQDFLVLALKRARADNIEKIVVGALISRDERVLLLRRPSDDFMGGIDELPSGHLEPNEGMLDALKREVEEETGLNCLDVTRYLGSFDYVTGSGKRARQLNFVVRTPPTAKVRLTEHASYRWASPGDAASVQCSDEVSKILKEFWRGKD